MLKQRIAVVALALALATAGIAAPVGVDEVMLPGEKFRAVIASSGETKSVAVACLAGARLTVTAKAVGRSLVQPTIAMVAPDGRTVNVAPISKGSGRKRTVKLPDALTGVYRVSMSSPEGKGGEVDFQAKASKLALSGKFIGILGETTGVGTHTFDALPGATLSVKAGSKGKPKWQPVIEVLSPSGVSLNNPAKATKVGPILLPELGTYTIRISGGMGDYKGSWKAKPQRRKARRIEYSDVESFPHVTNVAQTGVENDGVRDLDLEGFGFSVSQKVALFDGNSAVAIGPIRSLVAGGASAEIDVTGIAPGVYELGVTTPAGNRHRYGIPLTVVNLAPFVVRSDPAALPWDGGPLTFELDGAGFDSDMQVQARRNGDGLVIPTTLDAVIDHTRCTVTIDPPDLGVGAIDLEFTEPSGGVNTSFKPFDVYGFRETPVNLLESLPNARTGWFYSRDAGYSDVEGHAVIAVQTNEGQITWLRIVAATGVEVDRLESLGYRPRVAWNPVDDTWALAWVGFVSGTYQAMLTITAGDDLGTVLGTHVLSSVSGSASFIQEVNIAPNRDDGGWIAAWEEWDGSRSLLKTQPVGADGSVDFSAQVNVKQHTLGYIWTPVVEYQRDGRFLLIYVGSTDDDFYFALRKISLGSNGRPLGTSTVVATNVTWYNLFQPEVAVNPHTGQAVVAFSYLENANGLYHPGSLTFDSFGLQVGAVRTLDGSGAVPEGFIDSLAWNESGNEFAMTMTSREAEPQVVVRRMTSEGFLKPVDELHEYHGFWGILAGGSTAGTLGLYYVTDATPDTPLTTNPLYVRGARIH